MVKTPSKPCLDSSEKIINDSQAIQSHTQQGGPGYGHPLDHVLCNSSANLAEIIEDLPHLGCTEAVTKHLANTKTAFQSKKDQAELLDKILKSKTGQNVIEMLNNGRDEVVLRIETSGLMPELKMTKVTDGERLETVDVVSAVLILGHHVNKPENSYPHTKTFYPTECSIPGGFIIE